ncbi:unnamed protein product [Candidula unifasciata]|uniref:Coiled-coil domain-containing protein 86 n=1 Tax=Candidula unifasciata TaxID=100452 RepID=A0A8S3Z3M3_9EUPU|nr:unnamed protein product [Candidula unifasciata]
MDGVKLEEMEPSVDKLIRDIPRGKPKSGRMWKSVKTERYSQCKQIKRLKTTWAEKMQLKTEKRKIKEFQEHLTEEKVKKKQLNRMRAEANKKRKLLNERKSEITQPIKSTKVKKLKKKQLRMIETR